MKENVIVDGWYGLIRGNSCLAVFCDKKSRIACEGKAVGVIYLDLSKACSTVTKKSFYPGWDATAWAGGQPGG